MQFSSSSALEEYKAHLHAAHGDHRFVCPSCGKLFKLRGSLLVHERIVHNPANAVGSHICSACGASFNNKVIHRRSLIEQPFVPEKICPITSFPYAVVLYR